MGFFDTDTQRRTEQLKSCKILPSREVLTTLDNNEILLDRLHEQIKQAEKRANQKLSETLREDAEKLAETGDIAAADRYISLVYPEFISALDYIPPDALVFLDKPSKTTETATGFFKQHAEDLKLLIESGVINGKTAGYFLPWEMAGERLAEFALIMADNFTTGRNIVEPKSIVSPVIKQLPSYGGSAETAIEDVKHYTERKFSVVVLAADKRRAEILCDYFVGKGVKVALDSQMKRLPPAGSCVISVGSLVAGFELPDAALAVLHGKPLTHVNGYRLEPVFLHHLRSLAPLAPVMHFTLADERERQMRKLNEVAAGTDAAVHRYIWIYAPVDKLDQQSADFRVYA